MLHITMTSMVVMYPIMRAAADSNELCTEPVCPIALPAAEPLDHQDVELLVAAVAGSGTAVRRSVDLQCFKAVCQLLPWLLAFETAAGDGGVLGHSKMQQLLVRAQQHPASRVEAVAHESKAVRTQVCRAGWL